MLFLTAHRESILDLIKAVEIPRKLPPLRRHPEVADVFEAWFDAHEVPEGS